MKIKIEDGLPIVAVEIINGEKKIVLENVLLDTGCSTTIFDTDILETVGIELDILTGNTKRMYGVGGASELCYEQVVCNIDIDGQPLDTFLLQLGMTQEMYNFDGILGNDFMLKTGMNIDFDKKEVTYGDKK